MGAAVDKRKPRHGGRGFNAVLVMAFNCEPSSCCGSFVPVKPEIRHFSVALKTIKTIPLKVQRRRREPGRRIVVPVARYKRAEQRDQYDGRDNHGRISIAQKIAPLELRAEAMP